MSKIKSKNELFRGLRPGKAAMQEKFTLGNLPLIDNGLIAEAFDREMKRLVKDCDERPLEEKPRVLMLSVKITPKPETSGRGIICDEVVVEFELTGKTPLQRTRLYTMKPKQDGSIMFHPDLESDPEGQTIMDEVERVRREGPKH